MAGNDLSDSLRRDIVARSGGVQQFKHDQPACSHHINTADFHYFSGASHFYISHYSPQNYNQHCPCHFYRRSYLELSRGRGARGADWPDGRPDRTRRFLSYQSFQ